MVTEIQRNAVVYLWRLEIQKLYYELLLLCRIFAIILFYDSKLLQCDTCTSNINNVFPAFFLGYECFLIKR